MEKELTNLERNLRGVRDKLFDVRLGLVELSVNIRWLLTISIMAAIVLTVIGISWLIRLF